MDEFANVSFGTDSRSDLEALRKSLEVGYSTDSANKTGYGATRLESLDQTLKILVQEENTNKFWKALTKSKAESTVEEFTSVSELGDANFYSEGGIPEEYDEDIRREFELVKFIGTKGKIPNPANVVKSQVNNLEVLNKNKTRAIIRRLNEKCFFGNAENIPVEFNGVLSQFYKRVKRPSENVIDLKGKRITLEMLNQAGRIIEDNYGNPENIKAWMSNVAFTDHVDGLIEEKRLMLGGNVDIQTITVSARNFKLANGSGGIETDIMLKKKGETHLNDLHPKLNVNKTAFASTSEKCPATLNGGTFSCTPEDDAASTLPSGVYDYVAVPVNKYGAGVGFEVKNVTVTAGKKVTFAISDNGSSPSQVATAFEIYRKPNDETALTAYRYLTTFKASASVMKDDGEHIPGTSYCFVFDWDAEQVVDFKQLLPLVRMPLAVVEDSQQFLYKLYGTPIVFNPNKIVVLKNVGNLPWS